MTAPQTAPAALDVVVREFRAQHDALHAEWKQHSRYCVRCAFGGRCRTADDLAQNAEAAGWRWAEAERRALASNLAEEVLIDQATPPVATTMRRAGERGSRPRATSNDQRKAAQV